MSFMESGAATSCQPVFMKLIFIFCLCAAGASVAQIPSAPNSLDPQNRRQDKWVILYDDDWKEILNAQEAVYYRVIRYRDDLPQGKVTDFYRNGTKQWEGSILRDRPESVYEGEQTWYYENGSVKTIESYHNNELSGPSRSFLRNGDPANPEWQKDYYNEAYDFYKAQDFVNAEKYFKMAADHVEALSARETEDYVDILAWLVMVYHGQVNLAKQIQTQLALLTIYQKIGKPGDKEWLQVMYDLARNYKISTQWAKAEERYEQFISAEKSYFTGFHPTHGLALIGLSEVYMETQRLEEAKALLLKVKEHYSAHPPEEPMELQLLDTDLVRANMLTGQWTQGKKAVLSGLKAIEKEKGKRSQDYVFALSALGNFSRMDGQLREAEGYYLQVIDIMDKGKIRNSLLYSSACFLLMEIYQQLGLPQNSNRFLKMAQTAFDTYDQSEPGFMEAKIGFLKRLTLYYTTIGNLRELESTLVQLRDFSKGFSGPLSPEYAYALSAEAEFYQTARKGEKAEPLVIEAESIMRQIPAGRLSAAELRIFAKILQLRGTLLFMTNSDGGSIKMKQAEEYLLESNAVYGRLAEQKFIPERIDVLLTLAFINEMKGQVRKADQLYDECLSIIHAHFPPDHIYHVNMLFSIAKKSEIRNDLKASYAYYTQALQKLNRYLATVFPYLSISEKEMFYQANAEIISNFQSFAVNHRVAMPVLLEDLYDLQLSNKGIVFQSVSRIRKIIEEKGDSDLKAKYEAWREGKNRLTRSFQKNGKQSDDDVKNINKLTDDLNELEKQIALRSEDFTKSIRVTKISWRDVQKRLKPEEAAIEMVYVKREIKNDSIYVALVVRKDQDRPLLVEFAETSVLEGKPLRYYSNSMRLQLQDIESFSYYWKPLLTALGGIKRVYVSADGVFHQINLTTLYNPDTRRFVFDDVDVRMVPSTSLLTNAYEGPARRFRKASLFAHPDYGSKGLKPAQADLKRSLDLDNVPDLPGTEVEGRALAELFRKMNIPLEELSGELATEEAIKKLDNPDLLHVATHGFFLNNVGKGNGAGQTFGFDDETLLLNPLLRSGLLLAGCKKGVSQLDGEGKEDGVLTAFEAAALPLENTQLVVLSACETGLGEIKNGEGVYGLQRAFAMAGARQIIMSLWKVDDQATQKFMVAFYESLLKSHDADTAFRVAQEVLRKEYQHPYYWGAFVIQGMP